MRKLSEKDLNSLINEEISNIVARRIWEQSKPKIKKMRSDLLSEGYDKRKIDESIGAFLSNMVQRGAGLGLGSFFPGGESESVFGGAKGGLRIAIEQTVLEAVVKAVGLDPYTGFGLTLKNALEQVLRDYSEDELQRMFTEAEGCKEIAYEISLRTIKIIEESEKERILGVLMQVVLGELGEKFKTSKLTKLAYQQMRERFSEAFDEIIDEEYLAKSLSEMICEKFSFESIFGMAKDGITDSVGGAFSEFGKALDGFSLPEALGGEEKDSFGLDKYQGGEKEK